MRQVYLTEFKGNSLDDGPGVRSVVFFKGCPLTCVWCHNPETQRAEPELSYESTACVRSLDCVAVCEPRALDADREPMLDRETCTGCFRCADVCPSEALHIVGKPWDTEDLLRRIASYRPFYQASGGGVTLSGGEPTMFMSEAGEFLRRVKELGVHTLLETCGHFAYDRFVETMAPHLDVIWMDIKVIDEDAHRRHCGRSNHVILENFVKLHRRHREGGTPIMPRVPLVPGITATEKNLRDIAAFLREQDVERISLLPYNPLWTEKAGKLGRAPAFTHGWMTAEEIKGCSAIFEGFEIV